MIELERVQAIEVAQKRWPEIGENTRIVIAEPSGDIVVVTGHYWRNGNVWQIGGEYHHSGVSHWAEFPEPPIVA